MELATEAFDFDVQRVLEEYLGSGWKEDPFLSAKQAKGGCIGDYIGLRV